MSPRALADAASDPPGAPAAPDRDTLSCVRAGFDLCEVGQEDVVLKTGKLANRRTLHFALQALLALFGN